MKFLVGLVFGILLGAVGLLAALVGVVWNSDRIIDFFESRWPHIVKDDDTETAHQPT